MGSSRLSRNQISWSRSRHGSSPKSKREAVVLSDDYLELHSQEILYPRLGKTQLGWVLTKAEKSSRVLKLSLRRIKHWREVIHRLTLTRNRILLVVTTTHLITSKHHLYLIVKPQLKKRHLCLCQPSKIKLTKSHLWCEPTQLPMIKTLVTKYHSQDSQ